MKNHAILLAILFWSIILNAQSDNSLLNSLPKGYQLVDINGKRGPFIENDIDNDGKKDLAIIIFERDGPAAFFCIYLSSTFSNTKTIKYCPWSYMLHSLKFENNFINLFSDNGSMGQFGSAKFKYNEVSKSIELIKYEDDAGNKAIKLKDLKLE